MALRVICFFFLLLAMVARGETITENGFEISVTIPKGAENLKAVPVFAKTLRAVGWRDEKKDLIIRGLTISDLGDTIGQGDFSKSLPQKPGVSLVKFRWKEWEIPTVRLEEEARGKPWLTFNAMVPAVPRAIQVQVFGPAADEKELRAVLTEMLESLECRTNWLTPKEWAAQVARSAGMAAWGVCVRASRW